MFMLRARLATLAVGPLVAGVAFSSLLIGCYSSDAFDALSAQDGSSSSTSTDPTAAANTGTSSLPADTSGTSAAGTTDGSAEGASDSDGDTGGSGDTETTAGVEGPTVTLTVDPPVLFIAGPVELDVDHSLDAVRFELWDAIDDKQPQAEWFKGDAPPPYLLTQGAPGETRSLTVRAYDKDDHVGVSEPATVELQLPESGTILWETELALGTVTQARALTSGLVAGSVSIIPGFDADSSAKVSRVNAEGKFNLTAPAADPLSTTSGVALLPDGWIVAAGVDLIGGENRGWVARVDSVTAEVERIFEGKIGDTITGLALDHETGRLYLSGYAPKGGGAPDARLWALAPDGDLLWWKGWERPVSDNLDKGKPVDRGLGVAVLANGDPVLVGSSEFTPKDEETQHWAFVLRLGPGGTLTDDMTWVSELAVKHAGATAVSPDVDNGLLVAGWASPDIPERQATVWAFDALLEPAEIYSQGPTGEWRSVAVARLQTGEIVNVVNVDIEDEDRHDFEVRALTSGFGAIWERPFLADFARGAALTVTPHGHIVIVGTRVVGGEARMTLACVHP